jgi:hypothetical protein
MRERRRHASRAVRPVLRDAALPSVRGWSVAGRCAALHPLHPLDHHGPDWPELFPRRQQGVVVGAAYGTAATDGTDRRISTLASRSRSLTRSVLVLGKGTLFGSAAAMPRA